MTELSSPPAMRQTKSLPARLGRRVRTLAGELGQSMVELALVIPIFLFLLSGLVEIADSINSYITVVDVSRDGARLGSKGLASDGDIKTMVTTEMGRLGDQFVSSRDVTVSHITVSGNAAIKVNVCADHSFLLPGLSTFLSNPLRMCSSTTMRTITFS